MELHPDLPAEVAKRTARGLTAVRVACASEDPRAIGAATAELNEATVVAINAVYRSSSRDVPAGEDLAPDAGL